MGHNFKPFVFRPKSSEEQKNGKKDNTSADVQFSNPKSSEEQKKDHHVIRISPLHHESFLHLSAEGRGICSRGSPLNTLLVN